MDVENLSGSVHVDGNVVVICLIIIFCLYTAGCWVYSLGERNMNQNKPCEVEGCTGTYQEKIVSYCNLRKVGTDEYRISVDDYHKLETKKGYNRVVATHCDTCDDDLDKRLIEFCRQLSPCNSAG